MTRAMTRFCRDCSGASAVENTIWLPFVFLVSFFLMDVSIFVFRYGQMWDATRDASRAISVGTLNASDAAVDAYVHARLSADYDARVIVNGVETTVSIDAPMSTMSLFGFLTPIVPTLDTHVTMSGEPTF